MIEGNSKEVDDSSAYYELIAHCDDCYALYSRKAVNLKIAEVNGRIYDATVADLDSNMLIWETDVLVEQDFRNDKLCRKPGIQQS